MLLASPGYQSLVTLRELLARGLAPVAIALAGSSRAPVTPALGGIPLHTAPAGDGLEALARRHRIALFDGRPDALRAALAGSRADLILSSCYPHRLPAAVLTLPAHGCFNLHPSWLPGYRGPSPIFHQLRDGLAPLGVSVHRMNERLDAGELLYQQRLGIDDGRDYGGWVEQLTRAGVSGFVSSLPDWLGGRGTLQPQAGRGSYQGWPRRGDFLIAAHWSLRRVYNFVTGTRALGRALLRRPDGRVARVAAALDYVPEGQGQAADPRQDWHPDHLILYANGGRLMLAIDPLPAYSPDIVPAGLNHD